jgi:DNA-binding NtrC family response regulator
MVEQPSILLVEDEPLLLHNLQILLQHEGYRVRAAGDSADAIRQIEAHAFDLVITDLVMPGIDGFQVLDYVRLHCPHTVVVAVTGYISSETVAEALSRGADAYLPKPFDYHLLKTTIERALNKARLQKSSRDDERTGAEGGGGDERGD